MKARITRGRNFRGCISYVSDRKILGAAGKKQAEYICGTVPHSSVKEMVREMMLPLSVKSVEKLNHSQYSRQEKEKISSCS